MAKKKMARKKPVPLPKEDAETGRAQPEKKSIDRGKAVRIFAGIAVITILAALLAYYFPRGVLEVSSADESGKPVGNVEVWIWDKDEFEGRPEKAFRTDENGIARIKLFRGDYAVALQQELLSDNEPPVKYITFLEIKRGKTFQLSLIAR